MYRILNVDEWVLDASKGPGKGNRQKEWIQTKDLKVSAMFKVPREKRGEHWAEKLSCEIAKVLGFPHAEVDLATRNGIDGCLSYFFVNEIDGFSHFDGGTFFPYDYDSEKNNGYTIDLIFDVLSGIDISPEDFLFIIVFDALVANGDRHQDNWGITKHFFNGQIFISPLYDNSACLARELNEKTLDTYLTSEEALLRYIYKGKSKIGIEETKNVNHFLLVKLMGEKFPDKMHQLINSLNKLSDEIIDNIVFQIPNTLVSENHKMIIKKIITLRKNILLQIGENMNKQVNSCLMVWKNPTTRTRYIVGRLNYDASINQYSFMYNQEKIIDAVQNGFENYPNFPDLNKTYFTENDLFKDIKNRLPNSKRPDFATILNRYNLDPTSSLMEILVATKGRVATDTFEFIEEINPGNNNSINIDVAGTRYADFKEICENLNINDKVILEKEPTNRFDKFAVKVQTLDGKSLGYIPRYYSEAITRIIESGSDYSVEICNLDEYNPIPDEWISIKFSY